MADRAIPADADSAVRRVGEKTMPSPDQLSLFNEAEATADPTVPEPEIEQITYARKKQKGKCGADFLGLPTEQIVHELPESKRVCPDCGGILHACDMMSCGVS